MKSNTYTSQQRIQGELIDSLYNQLPALLLPQALIGTACVFMLWKISDRTHLLVWLIILYSMLLTRWSMLTIYQSRSIAKNNVSFWSRLSVLYSIGYGLAWGALPMVFLEPSHPISFVAITLVLIGLGIGASIIYAYHPLSYLCLAIPKLGLLSFTLFRNGDDIGIALGAMVLFAFLFAFGCNRFSSQVLNTSIRLRFENESLRQEAEKKSDMLESSLRVAEQANTAKTRFLAAASHDLRQPIHALGLFFATLAEKVRNPETEPMIERVEDSIGAIDSMLNALLDVSKLDAGVVQPNITNVSLSTLFARIRSEYQPVAYERGNQLKVRSSQAFVRSDPVMLEQILRNLVSNALRYTANGRVLLAARRRDKRLSIEIYDTGLGIPEDELNSIFLEFHQLGNPERDRRQGLGLGLAIVKRVATLLSHEVEVRSQLSKGSRFSLIVPLVEAAPQLIAVDDNAATIRSIGAELKGRRVLVLDDDIDILDAMRRLLESWGCQVATAVTPEQAISDVQQTEGQPELLIADYRLRSKASGLDAAKTLQGIVGDHLSVLIITGDTAPDRLREAENSGYPLLHKPVQPSKLRSAMRRLNRKRHS